MKSCILITSHLDKQVKVDIASNLVNFLQDKNLPIIFAGNFPLPQEIQFKSDYTLYIKENPKTLYNRKIIVGNKSHDDYGYAHLYQIGKGFLFCQSLGFEYVHHLNYDVLFEKKDFNTLIEKGKLGEPLVYSWGESGFATDRFSIKTRDYLESVENNLHFYKNENPPNITKWWFAEVFFKWALNYNNINPPLTTDIKSKSCYSSVKDWE